MKIGARLIVVALIAQTAICGFADGQKQPAHATDPYIGPSSPLVKERLEWFQDQKLCLMMHLGLYSTMGITESWPLVTKDAFWARADMEWTQEMDDAAIKRQYYALNRCFNPLRFDPKGIAKLAKRCGFRYVAFTTKHHDGFCLWDTKYTDYKTTDSSCPFSVNPNADLVKGMFNACRAEGLGISVYFSKADWHHEDFWEDRGIGRYTDRRPTYTLKDHPEKWERFRAFTGNQILELARNYGPFDILWLDGGWLRPDRGWDMKLGKVYDEARKINPSLLIVDRGSNDEYMDLRTPEQTVPDSPLSCPWETCMTMADGWGYHYDDVYKSSRQLIHLLIDVVAKGGNLALNVGPMPDGRLPRPAIERMEEMGRWLAKNGEAIYATRAVKPYKLGKWCFTRGKDDLTYAIRLWGEGENPRTGILLNLEKAHPEVTKVTHLATGWKMSFEKTVGDYEQGVHLEFPEGFARDEFADAFCVEYKRDVGRTFNESTSKLKN